MTFVGPRDVLDVDCTTETATRRTLDDEVMAGALGSVGLAVGLLDEIVRGPIDPFGGENAIVFAAGPFASTRVPAANKHAALSDLAAHRAVERRPLVRATGRPFCGAADWAVLVVRGTARRWTTLVPPLGEVRFEQRRAAGCERARGDQATARHLG